MNDDADLLRRYAEDRSEADFTAWVQRRFDLVYSAALRQLQGDPHRAREAAQIVFVDAARKAGALARHPALVGWLYTSTHFAVQKLIRSESRRQVREDAAHALQGLSTASAGESWAELRPYLDAEMLALGSADRTALLLRFFEQKPLAAIGNELGLTENAVRMRVDRALARLRARLARRGVTSTAAALAAALAGNAVTAAPAGLSVTVAGSALVQAGSLVSGGAGAAAVATSLMASKITMGIAAACGLLALGSGLYFRAQALTSAQSSLALERASAQWEARLQALPAPRRGEEAAAEPQNGPPPPDGVKNAASAVSGNLATEFAENPQLRQAFGKSFLAQFRLHYAPLAQSLGWSSSQMDQLSRLELKEISDSFDLVQAAVLLGVDGPASTLGAAEEAMIDGVKSASRASEMGVIGETGLQSMEDYDRGYAAREIAGQVAAGSFYSSAPLSASQADTLRQLLAQASPAFQQGGKLVRDTIDWDGVLARAAAILPEPQVAALRAVRAKWESGNLADAALRAEVSDSGVKGVQ